MSLDFFSQFFFYYFSSQRLSSCSAIVFESPFFCTFRLCAYFRFVTVLWDGEIEARKIKEVSSTRLHFHNRCLCAIFIISNIICEMETSNEDAMTTPTTTSSDYDNVHQIRNATLAKAIQMKNEKQKKNKTKKINGMPNRRQPRRQKKNLF